MKAQTLINFIQAGMDQPVDDTINWDPGPRIPDYPNKQVIVTPYGGPGEDSERTLDRISFQVRVIGDQGDYDSAEDLAIAVDNSLLSASTQFFEGERIVSIQRVVAPPSALLQDDADRTHFVCSYIATVVSAIAEPVGDR